VTRARQQVSEPSRGDRNLGGAIAGALIGGVLGHQVGGGSGKDLATVGGAVAGGVIGSNAGRDNHGSYASRDVRRCENTTSGTPAYWEVTYNFRGQDHHKPQPMPCAVEPDAQRPGSQLGS
jgi:uncharacterized protein YcfJ